MKKVFVLYDGNFSDAPIIGIYSNLELAEHNARYYNSPKIEKFKLDSEKNEGDITYCLSIIGWNRNRVPLHEGILSKEKNQTDWELNQEPLKVNETEYLLKAKNNEEAVKIAKKILAEKFNSHLLKIEYNI